MFRELDAIIGAIAFLIVLGIVAAGTPCKGDCDAARKAYQAEKKDE